MNARETKPRVRIRNGRPVVSALPIHQPDPRLIAHLEHILELAKTGEARSVIEVIEWSDGSVTYGWSLSDYAQKRRMLGEAFALMTDIAFDETRHAQELYWNG